MKKWTEDENEGSEGDNSGEDGDTEEVMEALPRVKIPPKIKHVDRYVTNSLHAYVCVYLFLSAILYNYTAYNIPVHMIHVNLVHLLYSPYISLNLPLISPYSYIGMTTKASTYGLTRPSL